MNWLKEKIFKKVLTNQRKYDIISIEIKKGGRETMRMISKKFFIAVYNWVNHKSIKNFCTLYRDGFVLLHLWNRPLWRCWTIFKHTYIDKRYIKISKNEDFIIWYLK